MRVHVSNDHLTLQPAGSALHKACSPLTFIKNNSQIKALDASVSTHSTVTDLHNMDWKPTEHKSNTTELYCNILTRTLVEIPYKLTICDFSARLCELAHFCNETQPCRKDTSGETLAV